MRAMIGGSLDRAAAAFGNGDFRFGITIRQVVVGPFRAWAPLPITESPSPIRTFRRMRPTKTLLGPPPFHAPSSGSIRKAGMHVVFFQQDMSCSVVSIA